MPRQPAHPYIHHQYIHLSHYPCPRAPVYPQTSVPKPVETDAETSYLPSVLPVWYSESLTAAPHRYQLPVRSLHNTQNLIVYTLK